MRKDEPHMGRSRVEGPALGGSRREFLRDVGALAGGLAASGLFAPGAFGALVDQPACGFPTPPAGTEPQAQAYTFPAGRHSGSGGACRRSWPTRPRFSNWSMRTGR